MNVPTPRRPFTAEILMAKRQRLEPGTVSVDEPSPGADVSSGNIAEILEAISDLRADLSSLIGEAAAVQVAAPETTESSVDENLELKRQLQDMSQAIADTKKEVASLRDPKSQSTDDMKAASRELDAVVNSTEAATNEIMEAAEQIDDLAGRLKSQLSAEVDRALAEEINDRVVAIFEACNFQDITGQRITKVVNTLMYVDDRVSTMMNLWGVVQADGVGEDAEAVEDGDLLNGPAPEGEGSSQADIDALFD